MKFVCIGYLDEAKWDAQSPAEMEAAMRECHAFSEQLRRSGRLLGEEALQSVRTSATLRHRNGEISVTDGPFAETKEQIAGIFILEADDLAHAVKLMSTHPGLRYGGPFEIRAAEEISPCQQAAAATTTTPR